MRLQNMDRIAFPPWSENRIPRLSSSGRKEISAPSMGVAVRGLAALACQLVSRINRYSSHAARRNGIDISGTGPESVGFASRCMLPD